MRIADHGFGCDGCINAIKVKTIQTLDNSRYECEFTICKAMGSTIRYDVGMSDGFIDIRYPMIFVKPGERLLGCPIENDVNWENYIRL